MLKRMIMHEVEAIVKPVEEESLLKASTAYLSIGNMHCSHCANWIHNGLIEIEAVLQVAVFFPQGIAAVSYDASQTTIQDLLNAVSKMGQSNCTFYWAEFIGQVSDLDILALRRKAYLVVQDK
jgi:copper chaperone CopZ